VRGSSGCSGIVPGPPSHSNGSISSAAAPTRFSTSCRNPIRPAGPPYASRLSSCLPLLPSPRFPYGELRFAPVPGPPCHDPSPAQAPPPPLPRGLRPQRPPKTSRHGPGPGGQHPGRSGARSPSSPPDRTHGPGSSASGRRGADTGYRSLPAVQVGRPPGPDL